MAMKKTIKQIYGILVSAANSLQSPFLLLVRLYWGWQFMQTGWGKVSNIDKVTSFFTTLGIPAPALNAHFIAGLELSGGALLVLGLGSRLVGLLLSVNMLTAYITADREALFSVISDPDKFYAASPYTFLIASLIVLIFGAGKLSVDAWIASRSRATMGQATASVHAV
jgi:putative oxidoreductase